MQRLPLTITRRRVCTAGLGLIAAGAGIAVASWSDALVRAAFAQEPPKDSKEPKEPSHEELMQAGPLGEEVLGSADAPITMIEYASMTCTHCSRFAITVYPTLKSRYIDTGKVRYIMREFPLDPLAAAGSMLARCAGENKYFDVVEVLFQTQQKWAFVREPLPGLLAVAKQLGFTEQSFNECLANQKMLDGIEWVRQRALEKFGVNSTPTFFINGKMHRGEMDLAALEQMLLPYLKS